MMQAGAFNPYFTPYYGGSSYNGYDYYQTSAVIGAWAMAVMNGNFSGDYYMPSNPVDFWTGYVYGLQNQ